MRNNIEYALRGKNYQEVLTMISTGEVHQYYSTPEEVTRAIAKRLRCPKFIAKALITASDNRRRKVFKECMDRVNLSDLIANFCN